MRVYLIRHGESEGNVLDVGQGIGEQLTEKGKEQIGKVSKFLVDEFAERKIFPDLLIASTCVRTVQSAKIIYDELQSIKKITQYTESDLFVERARPTEQVGKNKKDPEFARIDDLVREESTKDWNYAYSDGESMAAVVARAKKALEFLMSEGARIEKDFTEERHAVIVVVSHSYFLRAMLGCMVFGDQMNYQKLDYSITAFECNNASVSVVKKKILADIAPMDPQGVESPETDDKWKIVSWNSTEHLVEDLIA